MIKTKRWNDPPGADDGERLLVTRYRPRGVKKENETWAAWIKDLAPSRELHRAYAKDRSIAWSEFRRRYLAEMNAAAPRRLISQLAARQRAGETLTLMCFCADERRCHRTLLGQLIEDAA